MSFIVEFLRETISRQFVSHDVADKDFVERTKRLQAKGKEIHEQIQQPLTTWGSWRLDTPWQKKYGVKPQAGVVNIIDVPMGYPGRFDTWEELTK
ncbi:hypothetical protein PPROV_000339800 [Pycnococcus provasolii]|uniref:Uncharacterized protein n=2 Tax=Pycnococcus provasolii TaxID=41880 RepID=A0A830HC41_9CHLO|nr:hypothetical protein PPROV_000339800 [Pycnococcus provasolii]